MASSGGPSICVSVMRLGDGGAAPPRGDVAANGVAEGGGIARGVKSTRADCVRLRAANGPGVGRGEGGPECVGVTPQLPGCASAALGAATITGGLKRNRRF